MRSCWTTLKSYRIIAVVPMLLSFGCLGGWECDVSNVQELSGLLGNKKVVAYIRNCGATSDYTLNVSFIKPDINIADETGEIFFANHGIGVTLEKISPDTIKVIYSAGDILKIETEMNEIHFVYESDSKRFAKGTNDAL